MRKLTEADIKQYKLPQVAIKELKKEKIFKTKAAGRIRLGGESLSIIQLTFLNESKKKKSSEPKRSQNGRYVCDAIGLAAWDSGLKNGPFDKSIFVWIPSLKCFATWDSDHEQSYVFPDLTWEAFSNDPVQYLCAQWSPLKGVKQIWDVYELWKVFPYVNYASEFFDKAKQTVSKKFENRQFADVIIYCTKILKQAEEPLLDLDDLTKGRTSFLLYRCVSNFMIGKKRAAIADFESGITISKKRDIEKNDALNPEWFAKDLWNRLSYISQSLDEEEFDFNSGFITEFLKQEKSEVLGFIEDFKNWSQIELNQLLKNVNPIAKKTSLGQKLVSLIKAHLNDFEATEELHKQMVTTVEKGDIPKLVQLIQQIKPNTALARYRQNFTAVISNGILHCLRASDYTSARLVVDAFTEKIKILEPVGDTFEMLFINALCLITSNTPKNRTLFQMFNDSYLPRVKIRNHIFIENKTLALNLACANSILGEYKEAFFFLEYGLQRGVALETIQKQSDFDPIRKDPRFTKLIEKYSK